MSARYCHCGAPIHPWQVECSHRRACEARHLLIAGEHVAVAAAHAQRMNTPREARAIRKRVAEHISAEKGLSS